MKAEDILNEALGIHSSPTETAAPAPRKPSSGLPEHVKRHLAALGHYDTTTGAGNNARVVRCHKCRRAVFLGLDEVGLTRILDTKPLTDLGEAQALMLGMRTYHLRMVGMDASRLNIHNRDRSVIASVTAADTSTDIVVEHVCEMNTDNLLQHQASIVDRRAFQPLPADPPF